MLLSELVLLSCALATVLTIAGWTRLRRHRLRKRAREKFKDGRLHDVGFVSHAVLLATENLRRSASRGVLIVHDAGLDLIGVVPRTGIDIEHHHDRGARVMAIPKVSSSLGIPDLLRLGDGERSTFVFAVSAGGRPIGSGPLTRELEGKSPVERATLRESRVLTGFVVALSTLVVAGVAAAIYLSFKIGRDLGVQLAAVSPSGAIVASSLENVVRLTADGHVIDDISMMRLGMAVSNMTDLLMLSDDEGLVGDFASGTIRRCNFQAQTCVPVPAFSEPSRRFRMAFKFALAPDGHTLIASDTARHRLLQMNLDDAGPFEVSPVDVCFPNKITIDAAGRVFVADTNYHRILEWPDWRTWLKTQPQVHDVVSRHPAYVSCHKAPISSDAFVDRAAQFTESAETRALPMARPQRTWPFDFAFGPDGAVWVLLGGPNGRFGDVLVLAPDWQPKLRLQLPADSDPTQVLRAGNEMLVIDSSDDKLRRFDAGGAYVGDFSVGELGRRVREGMARRQSFVEMRAIAITGTIVLLLLAVLVGRIATRRRIRDIAALG